MFFVYSVMSIYVEVRYCKIFIIMGWFGDVIEKSVRMLVGSE